MPDGSKHAFEREHPRGRRGDRDRPSPNGAAPISKEKENKDKEVVSTSGRMGDVRV